MTLESTLAVVAQALNMARATWAIGGSVRLRELLGQPLPAAVRNKINSLITNE